MNDEIALEICSMHLKTSNIKGCESLTLEDKESIRAKDIVFLHRELLSVATFLSFLGNFFQP